MIWEVINGNSEGENNNLNLVCLFLSLALYSLAIFGIMQPCFFFFFSFNFAFFSPFFLVLLKGSLLTIKIVVQMVRSHHPYILDLSWDNRLNEGIYLRCLDIECVGLVVGSVDILVKLGRRTHSCPERIAMLVIPFPFNSFFLLKKGFVTPYSWKLSMVAGWLTRRGWYCKNLLLGTWISLIP